MCTQASAEKRAFSYRSHPNSGGCTHRLLPLGFPVSRCTAKRLRAIGPMRFRGSLWT
jgi:hypothetical protein